MASFLACSCKQLLENYPVSWGTRTHLGRYLDLQLLALYLKEIICLCYTAMIGEKYVAAVQEVDFVPCFRGFPRDRGDFVTKNTSVGKATLAKLLPKNGKNHGNLAGAA